MKYGSEKQWTIQMFDVDGLKYWKIGTSEAKNYWNTNWSETQKLEWVRPNRTVRENWEHINKLCHKQTSRRWHGTQAWESAWRSFWQWGFRRWQIEGFQSRWQQASWQNKTEMSLGHPTAREKLGFLILLW